MSRAPFEVRTCDRCGHSAEIREPCDQHGWGRIGGETHQGSAVLHLTPKDGIDLCQACVASLVEWRSEPTTPADQPPPPPPPPPLPPPLFTLVDRQRAKALVVHNIGLLDGNTRTVDRIADQIIGGIIDTLGFKLNGRRKRES